jgi:hypothetical protein
MQFCEGKAELFPLGENVFTKIGKIKSVVTYSVLHYVSEFKDGFPSDGEFSFCQA